MTSTYSTVSDLAEAVDKYLASHEMPVLVECSATPSGGYTFSEPADGAVPSQIEEPEGYQGDDELYYWGTNTPFTDPLVVDGFVAKSMHSSEHPTPAFIAGHLDDLNDGPVILGCVLVSFGEDDPEWAWVTG